MKVLLIRPPHEHMIRTNVPKSVDKETGMYPPLGLLYVAAGLKAWGDAEVELLDAPALGLEQKGIGERIAAVRPDVVGIQAMTFTLIDAIATVRTAKHVNLYPEDTLSIEGVYSLVLCEG
ncbi:MAG: cobalamin-dependent protein [Planctomycetota bacterium]|jgi:hypothetical protein